MFESERMQYLSTQMYPKEGEEEKKGSIEVEG